MGKQTTSSSSSTSKSYDVAARRAWRMLRLALLWARKGSILKARLMSELRHGAKYIKRLNHHHHHHDHNSMGMIRYGERELSFDDTPVIHLRSNRHSSLRFIMPCIKPHVVDFDYDFGDDDYHHCDVGCSGNFLGNKAGDHDEEIHEKEQCEEQMMNTSIKAEEEKEIDAKAEEFITKFYQQMKLQREISFQQRLNTTIQVL